MDLLKALISPPQPTGPERKIHDFAPGSPTLSQDGLAWEGGDLVIESSAPRTVRLFEMAGPGVEQCLAVCRARIASDLQEGRAYLEMWCRFPGKGEFFSKAFDQALTGRTDFSTVECRFILKKNQQPDLIKINLVVEGRGTIRMNEIELLSVPMSK
ncbi:MAG: hypothetical protein MH204_05295 [Fimbriimonadaceae bacterium]|nr:hypothetical protein [Fimbriimonadaceae bacterium]